MYEWEIYFHEGLFFCKEKKVVIIFVDRWHYTQANHSKYAIKSPINAELAAYF